MARSADQSPSDVWSETPVAIRRDREDACRDQLLTERASEPVDDRAHVDVAAELVEQRRVLGRLDDRKRADLLVTVDEPRRNARRLERRRPLVDVRAADEHALPAEQPSAELLLEPLPLAPRPNGEPNEPLVVMTVPKDTRAPRRLTRSRSSRLEQPAVNPAPPKRIRRRQPDDAGTDYRNLGTRNSSRPHCTTHHFGPTNSSSSATLSRCETEMLRGFDCVQRIPSSSQCSQKIRGCRRTGSRRSSADTRTRATRPLGSFVLKRLMVRQPSEWMSPRRSCRGMRVGDLPLPVVEHDRPLVLAAGTVLRESVTPCGRTLQRRAT